jgi:hypothetical protein
VHVRVEEATAQEGEPHGELGAVAVEDVVSEKRVVGRVADRGRSGQALLETFDPFGPGVGDRALHELVSGERKHQMELGAACEERLGPENVRTVRQGPVRVCRTLMLHFCRDLVGDVP